LYIFDLITDWLNAFNAYWFRIDEKGEDYRFYFGLTVAVITLPSIIMQVDSLDTISPDHGHLDILVPRACSLL